MMFIDVFGGLFVIEVNAYGFVVFAGYVVWGIFKCFVVGVGGVDNGMVFFFELC